MNKILHYKFITNLRILIFLFSTIFVSRNVDSKGIIKISKNNDKNNQDFRSHKYVTYPYMDPYTKTGRRFYNLVQTMFNYDI